MIQKLKAAFDFAAYIWHRMFTSRHVQFLEAEVVRLTKENGSLWTALCKMRGTAPPVMVGQEMIPQPKTSPADVTERARKAVGPVRWDAMKSQLEAKSRTAAADLRRRAHIQPIRASEEPPASSTTQILEQAAPDAQIPLADQDTSEWGPEVHPVTEEQQHA